jgi:hypothetical protein
MPWPESNSYEFRLPHVDDAAHAVQHVVQIVLDPCFIAGNAGIVSMSRKSAMALSRSASTAAEILACSLLSFIVESPALAVFGHS